MTIECENCLLRKHIDLFGIDFEYTPVSVNSFQPTVKACIGNTFFGWFLKYAGRMKLVVSEKAVTLYKEQLTKALEEL